MYNETKIIFTVQQKWQVLITEKRNESGKHIFYKSLLVESQMNSRYATKEMLKYAYWDGPISERKIANMKVERTHGE